MSDIEKRLAQPEMINGLTEKETNETMSVKGLTQPEPEPVAWFMEGIFMDGTPSFIQVCETDPEFYTPLYSATPNKEWVGLTDADLIELVAFTHMSIEDAKSVEAKLKEKNT